MPITVHNPDRYMSDLRTIMAQGRKRIGLLIGAGAPAGLPNATGTGSLIPAIDGLTTTVLKTLETDYASVIDALKIKLPTPNIEAILTRVRSLASIIGDEKIDGLSGSEYSAFADRICAEIGSIVNVELPVDANPYHDLVSWITGTERARAVEVFTSNYDLLLEQALERVRAPYFDGFTGGREPFFDPVTIANDDLPPRWTRLWKLHGSLGWRSNGEGNVIRTGDPSATHLIFPEYLKYSHTQKAPYAALFDRLRSFLASDDALLISCGFSFADAHISARIDEALAANASASVFAFQFKTLENEPAAKEMGLRRSNFSVYARDGALVNGVSGAWQPGDPLSRDWEAIRATYWSDSGEFGLGDFSALARFFALSRSSQVVQQIAEPIE